mgnify:CR=1 FL=1
MKKIIAQALQILQQGGIVAVPTDTVYGLAVDAANPDALDALYVLKNRPASKPTSVLIASADDMSSWAKNIPDSACKLAQRFWPGALTLILEKADQVDSKLTGGTNTIGLRVPKHPLTLTLLKQLATGLAAPSANPAGEPPAVTAKQVRDYFGNRVDLVLEGGESALQLASTIVDCSKKTPRILREGAIATQQIKHHMNIT